MTKYIFVTGGVVSSLGKGIATASIAMVLKAMGYTVKNKKLDPYLNIDPGTMNPVQHGEVFVTADGAETDLDLGHYERFTSVETNKYSNITAGKIYQQLLEKERRGDYLGKTVQTIPHVTDLIKNFIRIGEEDFDFVIVEIGGTVGDIEALPFLEAIRQLKYDLGTHNVLYAHLTLIPYLSVAKEVKTKPTQHSVKELMSIGIMPDILLCRSSEKLSEDNRRKIAVFCNVEYESVIEALDVSNIYRVPLVYVSQKIHEVISKKLHIDCKMPDLSKLEKLLDDFDANIQKPIKICIAGKYSNYKDAYKSILESLNHASFHLKKHIEIKLIDTKKLDNASAAEIELALQGVDKIIIPGGFGQDGLEGKIKIIKYARERGVPFLGICLGMQLTAIEFARNVCGISNASTEEMEQSDTENIISIMEEQKKKLNLGGTMRLGSYKAVLKSNSLAFNLYGTEIISERHRHRYEMNIKYKEIFEERGMIISGLSPDGGLPEIIELKNHPFFIGVQFHPEFKSSLFQPHPLFVGFLKAYNA